MASKVQGAVLSEDVTSRRRETARPMVRDVGQSKDAEWHDGCYTWWGLGPGGHKGA